MLGLSCIHDTRNKNHVYRKKDEATKKFLVSRPLKIEKVMRACNFYVLSFLKVRNTFFMICGKYKLFLSKRSQFELVTSSN